MKYLCHAVLHRGIVYYNTIINTNQGIIKLSGFQGEEEATAFVNGIIAVLDASKVDDDLFDELQDIIDECGDGIESQIESLMPFLSARNLFLPYDIDNGAPAFVLLSISPNISKLPI